MKLGLSQQWQITDDILEDLRRELQGLGAREDTVDDDIRKGMGVLLRENEWFTQSTRVANERVSK